MKTLEHKLPPPLLTMFIGAAMWSVTIFQKPILIEPRLHLVLTVVLGVVAFLFGSSGVIAFVRAKTTIDPVRINQASHLVISGIFGHTRNPMYVGLTALLAAWAAWLAVPWTLLGPVAFALFIHRFQIIPEERAMNAKFGRDYDDYCKRVRRWL